MSIGLESGVPFLLVAASGGRYTMLFKRFRGLSVVEVGATLANQFLPDVASPAAIRPERGLDRTEQIRAFLSRVDTEARPLRLGLFRKARLANSFRWRLLERGLPAPVAEELTQMLLLRLATTP